MPNSRLLVAIKPLKLAALQALLGCDSTWLSETSVVDAHGEVNVPNLEPAGEDLADGAGVREQQHGLACRHVVSDYPQPSPPLRDA